VCSPWHLRSDEVDSGGERCHTASTASFAFEPWAHSSAEGRLVEGGVALASSLGGRAFDLDPNCRTVGAKRAPGQGRWPTARRIPERSVASHLVVERSLVQVVLGVQDVLVGGGRPRHTQLLPKGLHTVEDITVVLPRHLPGGHVGVRTVGPGKKPEPMQETLLYCL